MTNQHWFRPKVFGYGASPTTWEGWAVVVAYCAVVAVVTLMVVIASEPGRVSVGTFWMLWALWFVVVGVSTVVLAVVSKRKTDGEWRWRWGRSANRSFRERWKL
jgi:hypothetical protein